MKGKCSRQCKVGTEGPAGRAPVLRHQGRDHRLLPQDGGDLPQSHEEEERGAGPPRPLPRRHHRHVWPQSAGLLPAAPGEGGPLIPPSV